jgi:phosphohistidine swiveling domain-containing protein
VKIGDIMEIEHNGRLLKEGDIVSVNGRQGTIYKFYKADGITSVAIKFGNDSYTMYQLENLKLD